MICVFIYYAHWLCLGERLGEEGGIPSSLPPPRLLCINPQGSRHNLMYQWACKCTHKPPQVHTIHTTTPSTYTLPKPSYICAH